MVFLLGVLVANNVVGTDGEFLLSTSSSIQTPNHQGEIATISEAEDTDREYSGVGQNSPQAANVFVFFGK